MQRARLSYAIWSSPRRAIPFPALIAVFAAALVLGLGATLAFADDPTPPGPVTGLTTVVGDTEVKVSWNASADDGGCSGVRYSLRLYDIADNYAEVMAISLLKTTTSYVVTGLEASTTYDAEVRSYNSDSSCGIGDSDPVYARFTTNAVSSGSDPVKPGDQAKRPPKRPKNLGFSASSNSLTISWTVAQNGQGRCAHSDYAVYVGAANPFANPSGFPVIRHDISGTSTTVNGITSGKYEVYVASYSEECRQYSTAARKVYTHP